MEREKQNDENTEKSKFGISGFLAVIGLYFAKLLSALLLGIVKTIKFIFREIKAFAVFTAKASKWLYNDLSAPMKERRKLNKELRRNMSRAKKESKESYRTASKKFWISYLFGKSGVVFTSLNYLLPIVSVFMLIAVIKYGSTLEYGISVSYGNKKLGVVNSEAEYEAASREVRQRINYTAEDKDSIDLNAQLSLKIISGGDRIMNSRQLANEILAASVETLTEAYGVYIDDSFVGAVRDKEPVQEALNNKLLNYHLDGNIKEVSYKNDIEYEKGMYLTDSVVKTSEMINTLTSSTKKKAVYISQEGDTAITICQKFNMSADELEEMNKGISKRCPKGKMVNVTETESFLPIQYIREIELVSFLDYETIEVETSALNLGAREMLVKGERGEKLSNIEITYVDGKEYSRKTIKAKITKVPIVEQIGIGTYTARPYSADTKLYGTGQFAWPVDGGWVSDVFISDRNHKGFDIAADTGTDIYASGDGVVVSAGWNPGGYGYFVMIDHLDGYQTVYAHMSMVYAEPGSEVKRGQLIGAVGSTGNSTGPHCHFEVRYMGVCYDPAQFMYTADYTEDLISKEERGVVSTDIYGVLITTTSSDDTTTSSKTTTTTADTTTTKKKN